MAKLIIRYPNNEIKEVDFDKPVYKIGKAPDNDLILENDEVDDHQAVIESSNGVFTLIDTSGDKSTKVNGKQVERVNITYGDRISLGPVVALFYPSKKAGGLSDKVKMALYISAGAIIIIASIVLIFLLITPKISSSITKSIGGTYLENKGNMIAEKTKKKETTKIVKGLHKEKKVVIEPVKVKKEVTVKKKKSSVFQNLFSIFKPNVKVKLPEPTEEEISKRKAIAIPRGIKRLFFRKVLVYVEVPVKKVKNKKKGEVQKEIKKWESEKYGEEGKKVSEVEKGKVIQKIPEKTRPQGENIETAEKKGFLGIISSPFKKIYRSIFKKKTTVIETEALPEVTEEKATITKAPAFGGPAPIGTEKKVIGGKKTISKIPKTTLEEIVNPLEEINKIEISQVKSRLPKESPIYSAEELKKINKEDLFENIVLSDKENIQVDTVWKYPAAIGVESPGKVIYSGSAGIINDDKFPDFIFTTKNGKLVSINGKTGEEILSLDLKAPLYSPIITGKRNKRSNILIVYKDGKIELYSRTLEKKWFVVEDHPITSLPVLADINGDKIDDVIVPTLGMEIVAVNGKSGFEIWRFSDLTGDVDTCPVSMDVNGDSVPDIIVNSMDGYINVIDGKTGWGLWKRKIYGRPAGPPVLVDLDGDGKKEIVSLTRNGVLTGYSKNGKNLFTIDMEKNFIIPPSAGDVNNNGLMDLVFMSTNGEVKAIEGKTRRILWKYDSGEKTSFGRIALADMNMDKSLDVVFTTPSGLLYVLDGKSGTPISVFNTKDYVLATPTIYDFNRRKIPDIIVPTYNGNVYCLRVSGIKKPFLYMKRSSWPSENHDIKNTGTSIIKSALIFWR